MYIDTIRARDIEPYCKQGDALIVDLRSKSEFERSHIPNAIHIPYEDIDDHKQEMMAYQTIILYCARGNLSLLAARELSKECDAHMISIGGGYNAYKQYFKL